MAFKWFGEQFCIFTVHTPQFLVTVGVILKLHILAYTDYLI